MGREVVSTVDGNLFAKAMVGVIFVRTVDRNTFANSVMGVFCTRPHCVWLG